MGEGRNKEKEILEQISFNYKIIYCAEANGLIVLKSKILTGYVEITLLQKIIS